MRLAIGDGYKVITISDDFIAEVEDNQTVQIRQPDLDYVTGRISVMSMSHPSRSDEDLLLNEIPARAKARGAIVQERGEVRYFEYRETGTLESEDDEGGSAGLAHLWHFEAGINNHLVLLSVTVEGEWDESAPDEGATVFLEAMREALFTVEDLSGEDSIITDVPADQQLHLNMRISNFLMVRLDFAELELSTLEKAAATMRYDHEAPQDWHDLGLAFGQFLTLQIPGFRWRLFRDEQGVDFTLQFKDTSFHVFPMTLFSKRKEKGTPFTVAKVYNEIRAVVGGLAKAGY